MVLCMTIFAARPKRRKRRACTGCGATFSRRNLACTCQSQFATSRTPTCAFIFPLWWLQSATVSAYNRYRIWLSQGRTCVSNSFNPNFKTHPRVPLHCIRVARVTFHWLTLQGCEAARFPVSSRTYRVERKLLITDGNWIRSIRGKRTRRQCLAIVCVALELGSSSNISRFPGSSKGVRKSRK